MSDGAAQGDDNFKSRIAVLEAELASVRRAHDLQSEMRERAEHEREQYRKLYTLVLYELERLKRQLFGKKAETVDPTQVQLVFGPVFDALARAEQGDQDAQDDVRAELQKLRAAADKAKAEAEANKPKRDKERKGHGRRNFDKEQAPVVEIVLEPPERKLPGGELLVKIKDEVSEHFEYRPASVVRVRVVRPKYRRPTPAPGQSPIAIAELPERPIPRSIAGPGLIAHVITQKFADHRVPRRHGRETKMVA
jgi:transposase